MSEPDLNTESTIEDKPTEATTSQDEASEVSKDETSEAPKDEASEVSKDEADYFKYLLIICQI